MNSVNDNLHVIRQFHSPPLGCVPYAHSAWGDAQRKIGTRFPSDYVAFVDVYGDSQVGSFVTIYNPFSVDPNVNFFEQASASLSALREIKMKYGNVEVPYPLFYYEPGGLLPWGGTENGDRLYWLTRGAPDDWTIVINEARGSVYETFSGDMLTFLCALLKKGIFERNFPARSG